MTKNPPDMDIVENLIKDPSVKGSGTCRSTRTPTASSTPTRPSERIAKMKPAAPDFLLMWDNAYCIHEFDGEFVPFKDILSECEKYGNADIGLLFSPSRERSPPPPPFQPFPAKATT